MKKRGRKSGSGSFVQVSLAELNNALKPGAKVIVWGRYANMLGLESKPIEAKYDVLISSVGGGKMDLEVSNFDDDGEIQSHPNPSSVDAPKEDKPTAVEHDIVQKPSVSLDIF